MKHRTQNKQTEMAKSAAKPETVGFDEALFYFHSTLDQG